MLNPRLAGRYAKSLIDLSLEKGQLEAVYNDIVYMHGMMRDSAEFVIILKSPTIPSDRKLKVLDALTAGKIGVVTAAFNRLLVTKNREYFLPEIVQAFIDQY